MNTRIVFMSVNALFLLFSIAYSYECLGGWFGPNTYEECILEKLKNAHTDDAVTLVRQACRSKFSEKSTEVFVSVKLWTHVDNDRVKQLGLNVLSRIAILNSRTGRIMGMPGLEMTVHNKTAANLGNLYVGITKKSGQSCSKNPDDYSEIETCIGYAFPNDVGRYSCFLDRIPKDKWTFCIVGLDAKF